MKKVLFSFLAVLFLAACEGPMGPPGRPGEQGRPGENANWFVAEFTVRNSGWVHTWALSPSGDYFSTVIDIPELTPFVFNYGMVEVAIRWFDGFAPRQENLPSSIPRRVWVHVPCEEDEAGCVAGFREKEHHWTEHFRFEYTEDGFLEIFYTISDFFYEVPQPGDYTFRVLLLW